MKIKVIKKMSRYLGPIYKKARRLNFSILENNEEFKKKVNVVKKRRRRKSDFGLQLNEKQKIRFRYHISEKQFKNLFKKVIKQEGVKGDNLIFNIEKRLDNVVYRLGFANTRKKARQLVNHGHILVNNKKLDIPSYLVKVNEVISLKKDKIKKSPEFKSSVEKRQKFSFLELDEKNLAGKLTKNPVIDELNLNVNIALVIEYYNRYV